MSKNGKLPENVMKAFSECEKDYKRITSSGSYYSNYNMCHYY